MVHCHITRTDAANHIKQISVKLIPTFISKKYYYFLYVLFHILHHIFFHDFQNAYVDYKEIQAAQGVKIAAKDLEKAIAGEVFVFKQGKGDKLKFETVKIRVIMIIHV
jgi:hypothetical protein